MLNHRKIDYGNFTYTSCLLLFALSSKQIWDWMVFTAQHTNANLIPWAPDNTNTLSDHGDLIEATFGYCRGSDFEDGHLFYDREKWYKLYHGLAAAFNAVHLLMCLTYGNMKDIYDATPIGKLYLEDENGEIPYPTYGIEFFTIILC